MLLFLLLYSCSSNNKAIIIYQYSDLTVTRVVTCSKSTFYYGTEIGEEQGRIWVEDAGIVSGYSGYIEFSSSGKIRILSGDGYFQTENSDTALFRSDDVYAYNRPIIGDSICAFNSVLKIEKEENDLAETEINVTYITYEDNTCF